eukprot:jgi/Psemu1/6501/gm1.6501_g
MEGIYKIQKVVQEHPANLEQELRKMVLYHKKETARLQKMIRKICAGKRNDPNVKKESVDPTSNHQVVPNVTSSINPPSGLFKSEQDLSGDSDSSKERKTHAEFGAWSEKVSNRSSSNFREAVNLVESLKRKVGSGAIPGGPEVFLFTDNFVAENTMYKGSSFPALLHNMILELQKMAMNDNIIIHFVWISGDFTSGVMAREAFLKGQLEWKITPPNNWFHNQLWKVLHVFLYSQHVFLCPTLMMGGLRKQLSKAADAQITFTPVDQFPVLLLHDLDNCLVDNRLMEDEDTQRFKNPRSGDPLMTPFQCKHCWFYNLKGCAQVNGCPTDMLLAKYIRRATLDAFWSQEQSTVAKNAENLSCLPQGPIPAEDFWGMMKVDCAMLLRSQDKGRNAPCVQFETVRKCHSAFTNFVHTCPEGVGAHLTLQGRGSGFVSTLVANSLWFNCFTTRCHRRMGDVWLPDAPVTLEVMGTALDYMEEKWEAIEDLTSWEMFDFAVIFLMSLSGINCYWDQSTDKDKEDDSHCVPLTLADTFKNQSLLMFFTHSLTPVIRKGRNILEWFKRMRIYSEMENISTGPLFMNEEQNWHATTADLDGPFPDHFEGAWLSRTCTALIGPLEEARHLPLKPQGWAPPPSSQTTIRDPKRAPADLNQQMCFIATVPPGCARSPNYPKETLGGCWTTSSSTRHHERSLKILTTSSDGVRERTNLHCRDLTFLFLELDAYTHCYPTGSTGAHLLCEDIGGSWLGMACLNTFQQEMPVVPTTTHHGILRPCHLCFDI